MKKTEQLNQSLKMINYQSLILGNQIIAGYNGETIIVEVNDESYTIKIGHNENDILRKQTIRRKLHKTVVEHIINMFDEAEELRDHYTELFNKNMAPFYEPKWLSETYYKRLVLS